MDLDAEFASLSATGKSWYEQRLIIQRQATDALMKVWASNYLDIRHDAWLRAQGRAAEARATTFVPAPPPVITPERQAKYDREHEAAVAARKRDDEARESAGRQRFHDLVMAAATELTLELSPEFLASPVDLYNGTSVTWGSATDAELDGRADSVERQGAGMVQTAARLRRGAAMIREAGVTRLCEHPDAKAARRG